MLKISYYLITIFILGALSSCRDTPSDIDNSDEGFNLTDFEPAWSPDGNTIAYIHGDTISGQTGIWLVDTNGANKHIIYASARAYSPSWSPDGQWITFSDRGRICKIKRNGDSLTILADIGRNYFPDWSPDGRWIAYDSYNESPSGMYCIWMMKVDGSQKHLITYDSLNGDIRMPSWSPEMNKIVHIRYVVGVPSSEIFTMDSNGTNPVRLTFNNAMDYYPKYSGDGKKITFTSQPLGTKPQILIMNSDGTNIKQLTFTMGYSSDWSPSEEWIVYCDARRVSGRLWLIRSDGSSKHQLTF